MEMTPYPGYKLESCFSDTELFFAILFGGTSNLVDALNQQRVLETNSEADLLG